MYLDARFYLHIDLLGALWRSQSIRSGEKQVAVELGRIKHRIHNLLYKMSIRLLSLLILRRISMKLYSL